MTHFIDPTDYDATVHKEIIDALTRGDDATLDICEERAISEMKSHLAGRYDVEALFSAHGVERHPLVLMMCLDIAVYHIYTIGNPQKPSPMRKDRYERAVEWMKAVKRGNADINGAPLLAGEDRSRDFLYHCNPKRCNRF